MPYAASLHISSRSRTRRKTCGFSLVEMMVVLGLVGVLCGLAIGWYGSGPRELVQQVIHQRNAQEIVSMGVYARLGGAEFVVPGDKEATVQNLVDGTVGTQGVWKGKTFRLSSLVPKELKGALPYVKFEADLLLYEPSGGQP